MHLSNAATADGRRLERTHRGDLAVLVDLDVVEERPVELLAVPGRRSQARAERRRRERDPHLPTVCPARRARNRAVLL
jgi:hypothetical protein